MFRCLPGFRGSFISWSFAEVRQNRISIRQACVGGGVLWIARNRLFEILNRFPQTGLGALVPFIAAHQAKFVDVRINGASCGSERTLLWCQRETDLISDGFGNVTLELQDVAP